MTVSRTEYDDGGMRHARCDRCRMGWIEHRMVGQREHACPDPYPRDIAEALLEFHASSGMPMHPSVHAACVVALLPNEISPLRD